MHLKLLSNSLRNINYLYQITVSHLSPLSRWSLILAGLKPYLYIRAGRSGRVWVKGCEIINNHHQIVVERLWGWKFLMKPHLFLGVVVVLMIRLNLCDTWWLWVSQRKLYAHFKEVLNVQRHTEMLNWNTNLVLWKTIRLGGLKTMMTGVYCKLDTSLLHREFKPDRLWGVKST